MAGEKYPFTRKCSHETHILIFCSFKVADLSLQTTAFPIGCFLLLTHVYSGNEDLIYMLLLFSPSNFMSVSPEQMLQLT